MNLRRKIYSWYLATILASMVLVYALRIPANLITLITIYVAILISALPVLLFLEYGIFLRVKRLSKVVKAANEGKPPVIKDYGHDEISDIADFMGDLVKERITLSEELLSSKNRVESVLDDAPVLIQRFDKDGNMIYINRTYAEHFDIKDRSLFIKEANIFDFLKEKGYDFDLKKDLSILTARNPKSENIYKRRTERGYMMWVNKAIFDNFGSIVEYQTIGVDITKSKESEERLKLLADSISSIVIWLDHNLNIRYASDTAEQINPMIRFKERVSTDQILSDISIGGESLLGAIMNTIASGERYEVEDLLDNKLKAEERWCRVTIKPIESGIMVLIDDIHEEVQNRDKLEKSERMRDFSFDLINDITSCDLKDIKQAITQFSADIGEHLSADFTAVGVFEKEALRIVSRWDKNKQEPIMSKAPLFCLSSKWWSAKFEKYKDHYILINDIRNIEDYDVRQSLINNKIKTIVAAPVSFNHTKIGTIFVASQHDNNWCDIDAQTVKLSGRLIGMALRPAVSKFRDEVKIDKKII